MASDGYTTIVRTIDPAHGELVAELLRREGIAARFHRVSSTLIGLPEMMVEMTVDVPVDLQKTDTIAQILDQVIVPDAFEQGEWHRARLAVTTFGKD